MCLFFFKQDSSRAAGHEPKFNNFRQERIRLNGTFFAFGFFENCWLGI